MPTETQAEDRTLEAWRDLLASDGWKLFRAAIVAEITDGFEEHITRALDVPDSTLALDRMRQVAQVRKAGLRWLQLPKERLDALTREARGADQHPEDRRGGL